jgi:hypothetical protein
VTLARPLSSWPVTMRRIVRLIEGAPGLQEKKRRDISLKIGRFAIPGAGIVKQAGWKGRR